MTIEQFISSLQITLSQIDKAVDNALKMAALDTTAMVAQRVFEDGMMPNNNALGQYKRSAYIKKRADRGLRTDRVTLEFSSDLFKDFSNSVSKEGEFYVAGTKRKENSDKVKGNMERYGNFFQLSAKENERFTQVFNDQFMKEVLR